MPNRSLAETPQRLQACVPQAKLAAGVGGREPIAGVYDRRGAAARSWVWGRVVVFVGQRRRCRLSASRQQ